MTTSATSAVANRNDLIQSAIDHCILPMTLAAEVGERGHTIFVKGSGAYLTDIDGKQYLDMMGTHTRAASLGYGNDEIARAMYEQARTLHYVGTGALLTAPTIQLATKLAALAPGRLNKCMFVSGGSESIECALKLARQYQQSGPKPRAYKTISRWGSYHGSTMGALSVTDWLPVREVPDPRVPGHSFVAGPTRYRNVYGVGDEEFAEMCVRHLERQIQLEGPEFVAAFIGEPIMQANGVQIPPDDYWLRVREVCDRYGVLLIIDEVITGFGRAGRWFAHELFGVEPDIVTCAKALSAGYAPLGAVITRDEIINAMTQFRHIHTFSGHAVACAAANAAIAIKEREKLIERAPENGRYFLAELKNAVGTHPIVGDVRGTGHWHAVDFTPDRKTRASFTDDTVKAIVERMRILGVMACTIGVSALEMAPPLIVTRADLDRAVEVCARAIEEIANERRLT
jgi:adenosylmethionine-8-amino-7-oxononanoate aminotransferase